MKARTILLCIVLSLFCSCATAGEQSHRAAAEELLLMTNPDDLMKQVWGEVSEMINKEFDNLGVSEELRPVLDKYMDKIFKITQEELSFQTLKDDMIDAYVATYTEDEILAIIDFYKTDAGQTFLRKMPILMQESMKITRKKLKEYMQKVQKITNEMEQEIERIQKQQQS